MPKDVRNETSPERTPSRRVSPGHTSPRRSWSVRPLAWVMPALLFACVTGVAVSPDLRNEIVTEKEQQASGVPSAEAITDPLALQQRITELDRQMDTVNAAMSRLSVAVQRRDEEAARSVDRIAELHQDLNTLVRQLKHRARTETASPPGR